MNMKNHIQIWDYASLKIIDVRVEVLPAHNQKFIDTLMTSYLFITQGEGYLFVNDEQRYINCVTVIHLAKNSTVFLVAEKQFEYQRVFYKAILPIPLRSDIKAMLGQTKLFECNYYIPVKNPISLMRKIDNLTGSWQQSTELERFHVKAIFYEILYELCKQNDDTYLTTLTEDAVSQVYTYIHQNYAEDLSLLRIANDLNYNPSYLATLFKRKTNYSIMDYVIQIRLLHVEQWLMYSTLTIKEIALKVGYKDPYYLSRVYKKHKGISPSQVRQQRLGDIAKVSNKLSIVPPTSKRYIDNGYQYIREDNKMIQRTKTSLLATLLICFTLLFSGCANNSNPTQQGKANQEQTSTVMYQTSNGEIEIPANPQRVVVVANNHVGYALALGVTPVAMSDSALSNPFFQNQIEGVTSYGDSQSLEKILDTKPDLIITLDNMENLEQLKKIAPTIALPYGEKKLREQLTEYGVILHQEEKAQQWIEDWDKKIAKYQTEIDAIVGDKTVTILAGDRKNIGAFGDYYGRGGEIIYQEFGLKAPPIIQENAIDNHEGYYMLSMEKISDIVGDYLFISQELATALENEELYRDLPAVQNEHVFIFDEKAYYYNDPVSLEHELEEIMSFFRGQK